MPVYCFSTEKRTETVERFYPVGQAPKSFRSNGVAYYRDLAAEHSGVTANKLWSKGKVEEACGFHPEQFNEAVSLTKEIGRTDIEPQRDGTWKLRSREGRKKLHEALGYYDKSGGYGDAQRR